MKNNHCFPRHFPASRIRNRSPLFPLALAVLAAAAPAFAVTDTFTGPSGDSWNTAADWTSGSTHAVPVNGDDAVYSNVAILNFNGTYSGVGLNSLSVDAVGHTTSSFRQTITSTLIAVTETIGVSGNTSTYTHSNGNNTVTGSLFLGSGINATGNYALSGSFANLAVGSNSAQFTAAEFIGYNGNATFTQTGANHTVGTAASLQTLYIGVFAGAFGNYVMSGSSSVLTVNGNEYVGEAATGFSGGGSVTQYGGTFTQSAGNHTVTGLLTLGDTATATGSYTLSGGNLTVGTTNPAFTVAEFIGGNGIGNFIQTGGTNTIGTVAAPQSLFLGTINTAVGTYTMSNAASTLLVNGNEIVGNLATGNAAQAGGAFIQNQGNHTVTNTLTLARFPGTTGSFILTGGNLSTATSGNAFTINEDVGESGNATFIQTGGIHTVGTPAANQRLEIGLNAGSTGSYSLEGVSQLTVNGVESVGFGATGTTTNGVITKYGGSFFQNNGIHTVTAGLTLAANPGSTGCYVFEGGTLIDNSEEIIGNDGTALFVQSGGFHSIGNATQSSSLLIAANSDSIGTYTINNDFAVLSIFGSLVVGEEGVGTLNISGGAVGISNDLTIKNAASSVNFSSGALSIASINTQGSPSRFHWTGGTLNFSSNITIDENFALGATLNLLPGMNLNGSTTVTNNGSLTLSGGNFSAGDLINNTLLTGFGLIDSNTLANTGQITVSGGNLQLDVVTAFNNQGAITLGPALQLQFFSINVTNDGIVNLNGGSITGATQFSNMNDGIVSGPGTITGTFSSAGTLLVPSGITKVGNFTNTGIIEMAGAAAQLGPGATITNSATIEGFGKIADNLTNNATLQPTGGTLIITGALTNPAAGLIAVSQGNTLLVSSGLATNAGIISLTGGTFDNGAHPLDNTGQITGYGNLRTGAAGLTNDGSITFTGGTSTINGPVTNSLGKSIVAKDQPAIFTGLVTNNGTIVVTNTTVTFAGGYTGNAYISDPSTNIFQGPVNVTSGGSMSGGVGDAFLFNSGNFTNSGNFSNAGSLQSSDNITNNAAFTQTGPQSWSPGTSFTNTAGKTTFGSNAKLYGLSITGGIFDITSTKLIVEDTSTKAATLAALHADVANHSLLTSTLVGDTLVISDNAIRLASFGAAASNFGGAIGNVDTNSILITAAVPGDANLDGVVDIKDLQDLANHWQQPATDWSQADFDSNGVVALQDLQALANHWQNGVGAPGQGSGESFADALALIGQFGSTSSVPEPTSLALIGLGGIALATRRRRKNISSPVCE